ncbi:hypothetical protein ACJX0J_025283 [Zea mays]
MRNCSLSIYKLQLGKLILIIYLFDPTKHRLRTGLQYGLFGYWDALPLKEHVGYYSLGIRKYCEKYSVKDIVTMEYKIAHYIKCCQLINRLLDSKLIEGINTFESCYQSDWTFQCVYQFCLLGATNDHFLHFIPSIISFVFGLPSKTGQLDVMAAVLTIWSRNFNNFEKINIACVLLSLNEGCAKNATQD